MAYIYFLSHHSNTVTAMHAFFGDTNPFRFPCRQIEMSNNRAVGIQRMFVSPGTWNAFQLITGTQLQFTFESILWQAQKSLHTNPSRPLWHSQWCSSPHRWWKTLLWVPFPHRTFPHPQLHPWLPSFFCSVYTNSLFWVFDLVTPKTLFFSFPLGLAYYKLRAKYAHLSSDSGPWGPCQLGPVWMRGGIWHFGSFSIISEATVRHGVWQRWDTEFGYIFYPRRKDVHPCYYMTYLSL